MDNYETHYNHAKLFSEHIRRLRAYLNISQETLAQNSGLSSKTIQNIEECKTDPRLSTIAPVCTALHLDARLFITPNLPGVNVYENELSSLLSDCNDAEAKAILSAAKGVKEAIRFHSSD